MVLVQGVVQGVVQKPTDQRMGSPPTIWGAAHRAAPPVIVKAYRVDPMDADLSNVPLLKALPEDKRERKLQELRKGAELVKLMPAFPEKRAFRDIFWIVPFSAIVIIVFGAAGYFAWMERAAIEANIEMNLKFKSLSAFVSAGLAGGAVSLLTSVLFIALASRCASCVVWTSLIFGPALTVIIGLALVVAGMQTNMGMAFLGGVMILLGIISFTCVFVCWRKLIPFMIMLVQVVGSVIRSNPVVLLVSVLGSVAGIVWTTACALTFYGLVVKMNLDLADRNTSYAVIFVFALALTWGSLVAYNVCHVTYCGLFGRWYYKKDDGSMLQKSLAVALTTSLGSIVVGSFLVAFVRALEVVVRSARQDAQQDGNTACCVMLLVVECFVGCIGDILEYFSEWAYVQCAIRGASFFEAARITLTFFTCANLQYILSDLLLNSVVNLGTLLCGCTGAAAGAGAGYFAGDSTSAGVGALLGLIVGVVAGGAAVGIISSGVKTTLACWAEDPEPLRQAHPEVHAQFESRILAKLQAF